MEATYIVIAFVLVDDLYQTFDQSAKYRPNRRPDGHGARPPRTDPAPPQSQLEREFGRR
jgi:hypothetical protein